MVTSLYYYFGVVRAVYWFNDPPDLSPIPVSKPIRISIYACLAGMLYLGLFPNTLVSLTTQAVELLR